MKKLSVAELKKVLELHKLWLEGNDKGERADLRSADLSYADLSSANLSYADLRSANLGYADLRSANLGSANLGYADLRSANLGSANLSYADLRSANLSYADLRSANLGSANLSYADLRSANLGSANLRSADLSYADLSDANLDYSCWGLSCKTKNVKVCSKIAAQLLTHALIVCCDDPEFKKIQGLKSVKAFCEKNFHRIKDGSIKWPENKTEGKG